MNKLHLARPVLIIVLAAVALGIIGGYISASSSGDPIEALARISEKRTEWAQAPDYLYKHRK